METSDTFYSSFKLRILKETFNKEYMENSHSQENFVSFVSFTRLKLLGNDEEE